MNSLNLPQWAPSDSTPLLNRRGFVKCTLGATALLAAMDAIPNVSASIRRVEPGIDFRYAVFDERFTLARAMGNLLMPHSNEAFAMQGDVTALWTQAIRHKSYQERGVVVGITTPSSLFCLQHMLSAMRMRVALRMDVSGQMSGGVLAGISERLITALHDGSLRRVEEGGRLETLPSSTRLHGENDCLVAWVISPVTSATSLEA